MYVCIWHTYIPDEITASLKHRNPFTTIIITDGDAHQIDLDPMMLTILGIVAGVLIVIIIVTLAIRIHASRSRGRLRTRAASSSEACGNGSSGNKVVVTTIGKTHALKKYAQFAQNTSCFYPSCAISRIFCYKNNKLIYYYC